jgi:hypothetical protein
MQFLADSILALRITIFAALIPWLFRWPLRRLEGWVEPSRPLRESRMKEADRIIRLTGILCRVARPLLPHPCQVRGLTLYYFLRRAGVDVSLVFGIGRMVGGYEGHCWLVKDGEPYLEHADPRDHFAPIYAFNCKQATDLQGASNRRLFT